MGALAGGILCDRIGLTKTLRVCLALSAVGLLGLPFATRFSSLLVSAPLLLTAAMVALFALIANVGNAIYATPSRLLISEVVPATFQKQALAWLRSTNNLGQVGSYLLSWSLTSLFVGFGLSLFFIFDATTTLIALILSYRLLPLIGVKSKRPPVTSTPETSNDPIKGDELPQKPKSLWAPYFAFTTLLFIYAFSGGVFDVFIAAKLRLLYGADGLALFSKIMLINTVFCALLSVPFSKYLSSPKWAISIGFFLVVVGLSFTLNGSMTISKAYVAIAIMTFGELFFQSIASYVQLELSPTKTKQGTAFGFGQLFQQSGKLVGATIAFPLFVYANSANIPITVCLVMAIASCSLIAFLWRRLSLIK